MVKPDFGPGPSPTAFFPIDLVAPPFGFPTRVVTQDNVEGMGDPPLCEGIDNLQVKERTCDNGVMRLVTEATSGNYLIYFKDGRKETLSSANGAATQCNPSQYPLPFAALIG